MGKKKTGNKYVSKGSGINTVSRKTKNAVRREKPESERILNQLKSWAKGRRTMITIANPNPNETNKRFIKVEGNIVFGPWRRVVKENQKND
jgi:hypothetical protein